MKLMIKLIDPQQIRPMLKTGLAECISDTLPHNKRKEPNVTPYEFCCESHIFIALSEGARERNEKSHTPKSK